MGRDIPQVIEVAGREIIHDHDTLSVSQQPLDEMRADEPSATGDEDVLHFIASAMASASFCRYTGSAILRASRGLER